MRLAALDERGSAEPLEARLGEGEHDFDYEASAEEAECSGQDRSMNWKSVMDIYKLKARGLDEQTESYFVPPPEERAAVWDEEDAGGDDEQVLDVGVAGSDERKAIPLSVFRTLVLDVSHAPIDVINWRRAITLDHLCKVEVLEYYDRHVRSAMDAYLLPAVVKVHMYVKSKKQTNTRAVVSRRNILIRDNFQCQYCGVRGDARSLTIDHVMPLSRGGPWSWENLVVACKRCNSRKAARTPGEANMQLTRVPTVPSIASLGTFKPCGTGVMPTPTEWEGYVIKEKRRRKQSPPRETWKQATARPHRDHRDQ